MKSSLDEIVVSAVDQPDEEISADQLAGRSTPERQKFDQGPVSAAASSIFVAGVPSPAAHDASNISSRLGS